MDLSARLKAAREGAGITQARAADQLAVSTASIAAYEQGSRDVPDAMLERMATLYGIAAPVLRYGDEVLRLAALTEVERRVRHAAAALLVVADAIGQSDAELEEAALGFTQREAVPALNAQKGTVPPRPDISAAAPRTAPPPAPQPTATRGGHKKIGR